ncbi:MAG: alpha/beta hydrolase [Gemmatimonadota bacterium]|nr:alpha/beta hydrolase [Gemmatimonadota bacterium]
MTCPRAQEPSGPDRRRTVPVPGARLRVRVEGTGPDVLLLHGLSAHGGEWDAVAKRLEGRFRLIRPDLADRGRSVSRPGARFRLRDEVTRLAALIEAIGATRPLVVGHSHGAALAVALAEGRDTAGLLLLNPVTPWTPRPAALALLRPAPVRLCLAPLLRHFRRPLTRYILSRRVYADPGGATRRAVERYAAPLARTRRVRRLLRVLADWRPSELSPPARPPAPAVVVAGARDRRIPVGQAARWAEALQAEFLVFDDCAHGVPEEAPDRVAALVVRLLASSGKARAGEHQE